MREFSRFNFSETNILSVHEELVINHLKLITFPKTKKVNCPGINFRQLIGKIWVTITFNQCIP